MKRAILVLYSHPLEDNAPTIMEHVEAFKTYSKNHVVIINATLGVPDSLKGMSWDAIVTHYSLYSWSWGNPKRARKNPYGLRPKALEFLLSQTCPIVMFFQDEMENIEERLSLINRLRPAIIYSLLDPQYFKEVYIDNTLCSKVLHSLTGYVSEDLLDIRKRYYRPFEERRLDIGYRARRLSVKSGVGGLEKSMISDIFRESDLFSELKVDLSTSEEDRIYGENWYKFLADCRFTLGAMAGTSVFDISGECERLTKRFLENNKNACDDEIYSNVVVNFENQIKYRTISPRIFEAAALGVCMVLVRDDYQGMLQADVDYIAVEKDFSNLDQVFVAMQDAEFVKKLRTNAYQNLISSGRWSYSKFVYDVENALESLISDTPAMVSAEDYEVRRSVSELLFLLFEVSKAVVRKALNFVRSE